MQFVVNMTDYAQTHRATNWALEELTDEDLDLMDSEHPSPDMKGYTRIVAHGEMPKIAVVLASGPSLCQQDVDDSAGADCVIAINSTWEMCPWADHLFANDERWWRYRGTKDNLLVREKQLYHEAVKEHFEGETWCGQVKAMERGDCDRHLATEFSRPGFRPVGHHLVCGGNNSGHTAINMAAKMGFANIILLGFDMTGKHWHPDHPGGPEAHDMPKGSWIQNMNALAEDARAQGYRIINATRHTALTCFDQMSIKDALLEHRRNGSHRWMPAIEWAQTPQEEAKAKAWRKAMGWDHL